MICSICSGTKLSLPKTNIRCNAMIVLSYGLMETLTLKRLHSKWMQEATDSHLNHAHLAC